MADVRTFRAATLREAIDRVREELGGDAVILHTRHVSRKRFLPWQQPIEEVEITASLTLEAATRSQREQLKKEKHAGAPQAPRPQVARRRMPAFNRLDLTSAASGSIAEILNGVETSEPDYLVSPATSLRIPRVPQEGTSLAPPTTQGNRVTTPSPVAFRQGDADPTTALSRRLDAIQHMLHQLGRVSAVDRSEQIPTELFQLYTELIDGEVDDETARDLIFRLKRSASPRQLFDSVSAKSQLTAMVESEIHCSEPIRTKAGRRKVVALVGATGVGKTTTIAKLAANFRLRSGIKMGLVTVDTYRVAAVEQLRTYAEIIDLPMKVVTSPIEMRRALDDLAGLDLVLIDTAGRSPKDDLQIQDLKSLLSEARVDEVHLVLSMTSSLKSLEATAETFAAAGTTALILTKLDESAGMGTLLSVARKISLPISYLTAGQDVPDDIEPAHPTRIARLVLGMERAAK